MPSNNQVIWKRHFNRLLASEVSSITRYFDRTIQLHTLPGDSGLLFEQLECKTKETLNDFETGEMEFDNAALFLNGNFNHHYDIQGLFGKIRPRLKRSCRVIVIVYNSYFGWLYKLMRFSKLRKEPPPTTFLTLTDLKNLARLSGFEMVRNRVTVYFPWKLLGLGTLLNTLASATPFFRWFALASVITFRPVLTEDVKVPSLSIVIPARNERGNIENAITTLPQFENDFEIIFIEGHSNDGTWDEIERVKSLYADKIKISAYKQTGMGKADAVRLGFSKAKMELLTILDADLTMPAPMLQRFYDAYRQGLGDFINGTRLVYPMEGEAMKFLNVVGNVFFAKALSFVLDSPLSDSLCGTKLLRRADYERILRWKANFGEFDPFGDFELLFPAAVLGLGIVNLPVRYRARTYGQTNIHRFHHGLMLMKMTVIGYLRIKIVGSP